MELSIRLKQIASMVTDKRIVDIGTDHGYIPIYLLMQDKVDSALAMDINEGPLESARKNLKANGITANLTLRQSNGFEKMSVGEADCAIIAGMGGNLMMRILMDGSEIVNSLNSLILQPQSELESFRKYLVDNHFQFIEEAMVLDEGKYYPIMKVRPFDQSTGNEIQSSWETVELRYGKLLLSEHNQVLHAFLLKEKSIYEDVIMKLKVQNSKRSSERIQEIQELLKVNQEALAYYQEGEN